MCGLVGVYYFDRSHPVDRALLERQNDSLIHRGPDAGGVFAEPGVGLGHRRLSIIDLTGGHQPMWDVEQRVGIIFNGEIYNYRELRERLQARGHRFRSDSDTETIIHAYREWGDACVSELRGMFAFAIYDRATRNLLLARDRLGKKPLYYYRDAGRMIFASELKAILTDPSVERAIEPTAVVDFFAYNYVPAPKTILQGIHKLPPAHLMVCSGDRFSVRPYWDVDFSEVDPTVSLDARAEELEAELADAVRLRLRSDVPLGAFLSGGIDSSLTVALMARQLEQPVKTHTIGFSESAYDERGYARETAELFHTDHREKVVTPAAAEILDRLAWHYDEPFGDSSALPTYYLCGATRERVTVSLSGDGGDESFAGYRRYVFAMMEERVRRHLPGIVRRAVMSPLGRVYPKADYLPQFLRAKATLTNLGVSHERAYFLSLTQKSYPRFLSGDFLGGVGDYDPFQHFEGHLTRARTNDPLARLQYLDLKMYLPDDILVKVDRASMAHALEVRVPLLDHRVVELGARMPSHYKLDGQRTKVVLKKVAERVLPPQIFERKKMGFSLPLPEWFRGGLKARAEAILFDRPGGQSGLLEDVGLRRLWYEHQLGIGNHAAALWSILMFEMWARTFLQREIRPPSRT
ncbi:MAG: asparagine synthase (glutamine-hydrolyzing) [Deltaproteobacteria bacterium]|nr:asparagine synthase (glutamine-hydrolyzing) [Deltaproteobacteria bacterium]